MGHDPQPRPEHSPSGGPLIGEDHGVSGRLQCLGFDVAPRSIASSGGIEWALARTAAGPRLVGSAPRGAVIGPGFEGTAGDAADRTLLVGPTNAANAAWLRSMFPWLVPVPLGLCTSAGLGDRLGLATPGHIRALRLAGHGLAPALAQQSIREMARTGRTPQQVLDDATWGVFEEGWQDGYGADADHLKEPADIDACASAGFTLYTIDPGQHVNAEAEEAPAARLRAAYEALPWDVLEDSVSALRARFLGRTFDLDGPAVSFDEWDLARAAVKYGRAVAHVVGMYRHLEQTMNGRPFELEVSVDETEQPTSHAEHLYVASELRRLGVRWVSLAPRFTGRFEKGVDYLGDLAAFEEHYTGHAAIARALGPYKLSLHSGSDKFSIYPMAMEHTRGLVHLKTAGTSYLEALRTIAGLEPALFREVYAFARDRYETDRASYEVSASLDRAPAAGDVADAELATLLDHFDARQILHVTFGSVLTARDSGGQVRFASRILKWLGDHPDEYALALERHFTRHLRPFTVPSPRQTLTPGAGRSASI